MIDGERFIPPLNVANDELVIAVRPRGFIEWLGTRRQILAEGVLPDALHWPARGSELHWTSHRCDWWLMPASASELGRRTGRTGRAWWSLLCRQCAHRGDGLAAAYRYELQQALAAESWQLTPAASDQRARHARARLDQRFQRVMQSLLR